MKEFYIISLKHTHREHRYVTLWRPDDKGYPPSTMLDELAQVDDISYAALLARYRKMLAAVPILQAATRDNSSDAPVLWWNGFRKDDDERDGLNGPAFSPVETTWHDIPLYAGSNPASEQAATRDAPAKYLVVAMDDDDNGHPHYCADEAAVEAVVTELMFSDPGEYEKETGKLHAADLIEEGFINFEGDPGIHLYRLYQPVTVSAPKGDGND